MPINKKYPIEQCIRAAHDWYGAKGTKATFEYVMIDGENNTPAAREALGRLCRGVPCKINLIPVNPDDDESVRAPGEESLREFSDYLFGQGIVATVRKSRGQDIRGACGQLYSREIQQETTES
jgi:23S rRNA (adenine2503-C2)-methyltransferase